MEMKFDKKLTATIDELQKELGLESRGAVILRAVALLKVCSDGKNDGKGLYLIDAETRVGITI